MEIQYMLIILATVVQFILGALWYSPLLFGKTWMKIMGADLISQEELKRMQKSMAPFYVLQLFLTFFSTFALFNLAILTPLGLYHVAFWVWLSFIVPTQISSVIWGKTEKKYWLKQILIMISYQFVGIMLAAWIMNL